MMSIAPERQVIRDTFARICNQYTAWNELDSETQKTIIRRIERNCFEVTINSCIIDGIDRLFVEKRFIERYSMNCNRVLSNLQMDSMVGSTYLMNKLLAAEIDPYIIAELSSLQLCPEASQDIRAEISLRQKQKTTNKVSRAYTCRKCGGNETIPIEFQSKATDEASTFSIKCVYCEYVWRI